MDLVVDALCLRDSDHLTMVNLQHMCRHVQQKQYGQPALHFKAVSCFIYLLNLKRTINQQYEIIF